MAALFAAVVALLLSGEDVIVALFLLLASDFQRALGVFAFALYFVFDFAYSEDAG